MDETEQRIIDLIEEHRQEILDFARDIEGHPEPGFQEVRTAKKTAELLKKYGYEVQEGIALTGVRGGWNSQDEGPEQISGAGENAAGKSRSLIHISAGLFPVGRKGRGGDREKGIFYGKGR